MLGTVHRALRSSRLTKRPERSLFGMKGILSSMYEQFKHSQEPGPARHNPHTMEMTETELFDEDAHELQSLVVSNPFDLEIMGGDANTIRNFGTVDNPVLMFSANVGWRYVMCSGLNDEDEGSSHVGVWFILREGPIHRCPACGQCFKLLNLKDEISEENDYYLEHYMPITEDEMGDDDDWAQRWTFHNFAEPYPVLQPHQNTHYAYILVNPDDHDRILTDPAYRLQRLQEGHERLHDMHLAFIDIEERILWQRGGYYPKIEYTPEDYEDLIIADTAIRKLDRIYERVQQYQKRSILDPENHERREQRMLERAKAREDGYTFYFNTNELERRYNDYFESDVDSEDEEMQELEDYEENVCSLKFVFKNYDFIEEGLNDPVATIMGVFERKAFRFKHRRWNNDPSTHFIKENRMITRFLERLKNRSEEAEITAEDADFEARNEGQFYGLDRAQKYREYVMEEAIMQYKDYFESEDEDLKDFEFISPEEKATFAQIFKDYSRPINERKEVVTIPKRPYDSSKGLWTNLTEHITDLRTRLLPQIQTVSVNAAAKEYGMFSRGKDFKLGEGSVDIEQIENVEKVFGDVLDELDDTNRHFNKK